MSKTLPRSSHPVEGIRNKYNLHQIVRVDDSIGIIQSIDTYANGSVFFYDVAMYKDDGYIDIHVRALRYKESDIEPYKGELHEPTR